MCIRDSRGPGDFVLEFDGVAATPDGFDGRGELRQIIQGDIVPTEGKISRKGLPAVPGAEPSDFLHDSSLGRGAASAPLGGYSRTKVEMTSS